MNAAFGVRLEGFPLLAFGFPDVPSSRAALSWTHRSGQVSGRHFFMRDVGSHISIGWGGFARYDIDIDGHESRVTTTLQVDESEAATAFVFSVLPLILPAWNLEPFHGSAVLTQAGALVVLGPSGSGKSSTASVLERSGFALLTDDACAFDHELRLWPGPAAINPRWTDALQPPVGDYNEKAIRKPALHSSEAVCPAGVVVLYPGDYETVEVCEPSPEERLRAILANARHGTFLLERRQILQFRVATMLGRLPVVIVRLDPARHGPEEIVQAIVPWSARIGLGLQHEPSIAGFEAVE